MRVLLVDRLVRVAPNDTPSRTMIPAYVRPLTLDLPRRGCALSIGGSVDGYSPRQCARKRLEDQVIWYAGALSCIPFVPETDYIHSLLKLSSTE